MPGKGELIDEIVETTGISKSEVDQVTSMFIDIIKREIKKDEKVTWPGFGTFSRSERASRMGRNPSTGEQIQIKASRSAKFKVAGALKKELTEGM